VTLAAVVLEPALDQLAGERSRAHLPDRGQFGLDACNAFFDLDEPLFCIRSVKSLRFSRPPYMLERQFIPFGQLLSQHRGYSGYRGKLPPAKLHRIASAGEVRGNLSAYLCPTICTRR
jgi:hypothetical protein